MCQVILDCVQDILTITLTLGLVKFYGECLCFRRHLTWLVLSCMFCLFLWAVVPVSAQFPQPFCHLSLSCMCNTWRLTWDLGIGFSTALVIRVFSMLIKIRSTLTWGGEMVSPSVHEQIYEVTFLSSSLLVISLILCGSRGRGSPFPSPSCKSFTSWLYHSSRRTERKKG